MKHKFGPRFTVPSKKVKALFKKLLLGLVAALIPILAHAQGFVTSGTSPAQQTVQVGSQTVVAPIPGAIITVCAANTTGNPCSPALTNALFKDLALTQPLSNPFQADTNGNWQFAIANGTYTVTVTGSGLVGNSFQVTVGGGGGGGGGSPAGNNGDLQMKNGAALAASHINDNGTVLNHTEDSQFQGPNPYTDIRSYGARAIPTNGPPAIPGVTANCVGGNANVAISTASTFQNSDGVTLFGCGTTHSMTAPAGITVTPSIASAGTGTGNVVNGPTGATTYNYQVIALNSNGGMTAASTVASTTTGASSLGFQTVNITSISKSGTTNTATTSAHTLPVGCSPCGMQVVIIQTSDDVDFGGIQIVQTVPDSTHFTYINGFDSANGAPTSATGGTFQYYNCNHLSWSNVTGAFLYYIYGRTGGSLTLLGVTQPQWSGSTTAFWDDFGSPMMDNFTAPYYVPTTPPGAATSNNLTTTIASGAGTTTLTLTLAPTTSKTGTTILFDDGPALKAACAVNGSSCYIPFGTFVINSYTSVSASNLSVLQAGTLFLNDTIQMGSGTWTGVLQSFGPTSFGWKGGAGIGLNRANIGIYIPPAGVSLFNLSFGNLPNNYVLLALDQTQGGAFENLNFTGGAGGSTDYMGVPVLINGLITNTTFNVYWRNIGVNVPQGLNTLTPVLQCNFCGAINLENFSMSGRGMYFKVGDKIVINRGRLQASSNPAVMFGGLSNGPSTIKFSNFELDTGVNSLMASASSGSLDSSTITIESAGFPSVNGVSVFPNVSGPPIAHLYCVITCGAVQNDYTTLTNGTGVTGSGTNVTLGVNGSANIGYLMPTPAAPTVVLGTAGSCVSNCFPAGTWYFGIAGVDHSGHFSHGSPASAPVTTDGTKTITLNWVLLPGQTLTVPSQGSTPTNMLYRGDNAGNGVSGTSFSVTGSFSASCSAPCYAGAKPGAMSAGADSNGLAAGQVTTYGPYAGLYGLGGSTTAPPSIPANSISWLGPASNSFTSFALQLSANQPSSTTPFLSCGTPSGSPLVSTCNFTGGNVTSTTGAVILSPACGGSPNCFQVFADGQYATGATWTGGGVAGSTIPTTIATNDNDAGAEWANITTATPNFGSSIVITGATTWTSGMAAFKVAGTLVAGSCFGTNEQGGSATTVTVSVNPTGGSGHILIAFASGAGPQFSGPIISSISFTDNSGSNTWNNLTNTLSYTGTALYSALGYASNVVAGPYTLTATFSGSTPFRSVFACEFSGLATSSVLDASAPGIQTGGGTATAYAGTISTTGNDLVFQAVRAVNSTSTFAAGTMGITQTITTAGTDPPFVAGDVGKKVILTSNCDVSNGYIDCTSWLQPASIASFIDAHNVKVTAITGTSNPAPTNGFVGWFVWGHDDVAQFQAAFAQTITIPGTTLFLPCGTSLLGGQPFNVPNATFPQYNPNIIGCGAGATNGTVLVPTADFNFNGANGALIFYNNSTNQINTNNQIQGPFLYGRLSEFTVWGAGQSFSGFDNNSLPVFYAKLYEMQDVNLSAWLTSNTNVDVNCLTCRLQNTQIWSGPQGGVTVVDNSPQVDPNSIRDSLIYVGIGPAITVLTNGKLVTENDSLSAATGNCTTNGFSVYNNGGVWNSYGDSLSSVWANAGTSFINGATQFGVSGCVGYLKVSGGTVGLQNTFGWSNVSMTSGSILDQCFNQNNASLPWTQAGTFSISGGTVIGDCSSSQTTQTSGNWSVPAGSSAGQWGTTPSVGSCSGFSRVQTCTITVGSGTVGANPVLTVTQPNKFAIAPQCDARMIGGTATFSNFTTGTATTSSVPFTYNGTPAASSTIVLKVSCSL
jgi:hypothetical protein